MQRTAPIIAIGNVPPPVTGKTVVTQAVFDDLVSRAAGDLKFYSPSVSSASPLRILRKLGAHVAALGAAVRARIGGRPALIYLVSDSGRGVFLTAIFSWLLDLVAKDVIVHHHGAVWVSRYSRILNALMFRAGSLHVTQCKTMSRMLQRCYVGVDCLELSNAFLVSAAPVPAPEMVRNGDQPFRLCHLSNLTLEKGLGRVVETFEALKARGQPVALRLGGPATTASARQVLERALEQHPEIEHVPHVAEGMKRAFFADAHVFLFPSAYAIETQGIVTLESLAYGVPLIAFPRCCLRETLSDGGGVAVESSRNFAEVASRAIEMWIGDPAAHAKARAMARDRFGSLCQQSLIEKERLLERLFSPLS